ncbi:hypothetical protein GR11A_00034 [Vibrio phage vB_VcorM_GR11A]|nr:hypothetical protein GR11A_00034 [Vibrio phage vB_VcorM_GR11A]
MAKQLLIQDINEETRHVYVTNNTQGKHRGPILVTVDKVKGNGKDTILIPNSWMAVDLVHQVHPLQLSESNDFRRLIRSGVVTLLTEKQAAKHNNRPGAEEEAERLRREQLNIETDASARGMGGQGASLFGGDVQTIMTPEEQKLGEPSVQVETLMLEAENTDQVALINSLRNIVSSLTQADLKFVRKQAKGLGYTKLTKWSNSQLKKLEG